MSYAGDVGVNIESGVRRGNVYTLTKEVTLAQSETRDFVLKTGSAVVSLISMGVGTTSIETTVELREGLEFTGGTGTLLMSFNRNRNFKSVLFPIADARDNPVITNNGTLVEAFTVFGQAGQGNNKTAFATDGIVYPFILEPDTSYALRFTNNDNASRSYRIALYLGHNAPL